MRCVMLVPQLASTEPRSALRGCTATTVNTQVRGLSLEHAMTAYIAKVEAAGDSSDGRRSRLGAVAAQPHRLQSVSASRGAQQLRADVAVAQHRARAVCPQGRPGHATARPCLPGQSSPPLPSGPELATPALWARARHPGPLGQSSPPLPSGPELATPALWAWLSWRMPLRVRREAEARVHQARPKPPIPRRSTPGAGAGAARGQGYGPPGQAVRQEQVPGAAHAQADAAQARAAPSPTAAHAAPQHAHGPSRGRHVPGQQRGRCRVARPRAP